jgi:two-component system, NtrC family, nitrogen regulation response regulator NtrX
MAQLRSELVRLAASSAPLLLLGDSGTDREQLAHFVHRSGPASAEPFVVIDCRTLREEGAAGLLFGDSNGPGLFEQAQHGTVLLGDVEDLSASTQRLLSGVLASGRFTRVGGGDSIPLEARIVSSARPGIVNLVMAEEFRRDLYAQLSVLLVRVPALREYTEDVPELLRHQVDVLTDTEGLHFRRFSVAAQNRLRNYPWPDDVRELRSLTRRLLLNDGPEEISLEEVERELSAQTPPGEPLVKHDLLALPMREAREQFERAYLQQQLTLCNGKVGLLAKRVDMERTHLYRKLRSLGIEIGHGAEE